jgi:CRP-like cAMP-binding protein
MDINTDSERLGAVPLFRALDRNRLKLLAFTSERVTYGSGEIIFRAGDAPEHAYVICSGEAEVLAETDDGETIVAATLGRDALFGEMAILRHVTRSATMRAKGELVVLRIGANEFLKLLAENSATALEVMRILSDKLALAFQQFEALEDRVRDLETARGVRRHDA